MTPPGVRDLGTSSLRDSLWPISLHGPAVALLLITLWAFTGPGFSAFCLVPSRLSFQGESTSCLAALVYPGALSHPPHPVLSPSSLNQ